EDLARTRGWIRELARAWRPDVVHLNSFGAGDAGLAEPTLTVGHACVPSWWRAALGSPPPEDWRRYRQPGAARRRSARLGGGPAQPPLTVGHSCVPSWWRAVLGRPLPEDWRRYRALVATSLRSADLVVAPTAWMLGELVREYGPLPRHRVIRNGRRRPWLSSR